MHLLTTGYRGLSLLMMLNADRMLYVAALAVALVFGAWLGTV